MDRALGVAAARKVQNGQAEDQADQRGNGPRREILAVLSRFEAEAPTGAERREQEMLRKLLFLEVFYHSHGHINVGQVVRVES